MYPRSGRVAAIAVIALLLGLVLAAGPYVRAAGLVVRAAELGGRVEGAARLVARPVDRRPEITIPSRDGAIPADVYEPRGGARRTVLLMPGIHPMGMREERLTRLATELAAGGVRVVALALPDLVRYAITPDATDVIEDVVWWSAARPDWAPDGRVGIVGVSFAGGLAIVAAGRESIADRVAFVVSFGGHGDLPRVMRYLATGDAPPADNVRTVPPHEFGVAVLLFELADRAVPPDQAAALRDVLAVYLAASQLTLVDRPLADREFARARTMGDKLPEPSRSLMRLVNGRDTRALGATVLPLLDRLGADTPELSPARAMRVPSAPVYLIHGSEDSIVPTAESVLLAAHLRTRGVTVRLVITPLITHADVNRSEAATAVWQLVRLWAEVLRR